ncbi:uncharacterized protein LOC110824710 [Carica papaya]|uniref:uncharacterized protein LOC110824710 n=1 Tax=Carica papaya TaxID=3649 RepID=UPI000B8CDDDA|nr:uncharacterized protein LOC110824710 [Carica papaya]
MRDRESRARPERAIRERKIQIESSQARAKENCEAATMCDRISEDVHIRRAVGARRSGRTEMLTEEDRSASSESKIPFGVGVRVKALRIKLHQTKRKTTTDL